jgi:hypothetical protein
VVSARRSPDGMSATITVRDLDASALEAIARDFDATIESEGLGLEEIFLEIHQ